MRDWPPSEPPSSPGLRVSPCAYICIHPVRRPAACHGGGRRWRGRGLGGRRGPVAARAVDGARGGRGPDALAPGQPLVRARCGRCGDGHGGHPQVQADGPRRGRGVPRALPQPPVPQAEEGQPLAHGDGGSRGGRAARGGRRRRAAGLPRARALVGPHPVPLDRPDAVDPAHVRRAGAGRLPRGRAGVPHLRVVRAQAQASAGPGTPPACRGCPLRAGARRGPAPARPPVVATRCGARGAAGGRGRAPRLPLAPRGRARPVSPRSSVGRPAHAPVCVCVRRSGLAPGTR